MLCSKSDGPDDRQIAEERQLDRLQDGGSVEVRVLRQHLLGDERGQSQHEDVDHHPDDDLIDPVPIASTASTPRQRNAGEHRRHDRPERSERRPNPSRDEQCSAHQHSMAMLTTATRSDMPGEGTESDRHRAFHRLVEHAREVKRLARSRHVRNANTTSMRAMERMTWSRRRKPRVQLDRAEEPSIVAMTYDTIAAGEHQAEVPAKEILNSDP